MQVSKLPQAPSSASATPPRPAAAAPAAPNPAFLHEVRCARFFYLDQFILLATGNKLCVYRWVIPSTACVCVPALKHMQACMARKGECGAWIPTRATPINCMGVLGMRGVGCAVSGL